MFLPESINKVAPLILKYLRDELTIEEEIRLEQWAAESERNRVFLENISEEKILKIAADYEEAKLWEKVQQGVSTPALSEPTPPYRRPFYLRYAAAALVFIVLGAGTWLIWKSNRKPVTTKQSLSEYKNDIAPGGNKALLTLANGSRIVLDTADKGKIIEEGQAKILKTENGQLAYVLNASSAFHGNREIFNTVETPRGGQYQVLLADGTRVWLNAASSLRYPVYFNGKARTVELTGEAYFEVAKNLKLPFQVIVNGMEVEVLGTHFNINAYKDEREVKTTLLEGSVKITIGTQGTLLKPGQQSLVDEGGILKVVDNVNTDEIISWKNGYFQFNDAGIESIMKMVSRWYDVDIAYDGNIPDHFNAAEEHLMIQLHYRVFLMSDF